MTILLASLADAAAVLAIALVATALMRRRSAALRHAILASAIATALLMPAFELLLPQLPVIRWHGSGTIVSSGLTLISGDETSGSAVGGTLAAAEEDVEWTAVLMAVWVIGAIVTCGGLMTGLTRLARFRARCAPVAGRWRELADELSRECGVGRPVDLLQSGDPSLLVTCGVLNPAIILPAGAPAWADERMRIVLRHELAHIRRHDALLQIAGEALRVLQWINPLVWAACRRLRQESEYACDDAVLNGGVEATEYATHLLDVARHLSGRHATWVSAAAIAHPSTLERRIAAMLHRQKNRAPLGRRGWSLASLIALGVGLPLAAAGIAPAERPNVVRSEPRDVALPSEASGSVTNAEARDMTAAPPRSAAPAAAELAEKAAAVTQATATIAGTVVDESGGSLPGVRLTVTDPQTGTQLTSHTDASGRFAFRNLQPAQYELVASLAGFTTVSNVLTLPSGAAVQRTITLPLGSLQETITVACTAPAWSAARVSVSFGGAGLSVVARIQQHVRSLGASLFPVLSAQEPPAAPIRVGGNVRAPMKIKDVKPHCPSTLPATEATVRLTGRVGVDGFMNEVRPVPADNGAEAPTELIESALDAVRQWRFTPTLLNGQPVEVDIAVKVTFTRIAEG